MIKACLVFDVLQHVINSTVFDQDYNVLYHLTESKELVTLEDGRKAEDLDQIVSWVKESFNKHQKSSEYSIVAVNFTSYNGALAHLDQNNKPVLPVFDSDSFLSYKIRKSIETKLEAFGLSNRDLQITECSFETSAFQLLSIRETKPELFPKIKKSLSLAQYLQGLFSNNFFNDFTCIGCHSAAWDFEKNTYQNWIAKEGLCSLELQTVLPSTCTFEDKLIIGPGLYYKVAETLPFQVISKDPFIFLSTGAWTVCINPFNHSEASESDLRNNCFNILNTNGKRIKIARLFSGNEHSRQISHLATHYSCEEDFYLTITYNPTIIRKLRNSVEQVTPEATGLERGNDSPFMERNLNNFETIEEAYHQFIMDLVAQQVASIKLTLDSRPIIRKIYVEGGLAKNEIFMQLLTEAFHDKFVYKVGFEDSSAMGAAMIIGDSWGARKPSEELLEIELIE